MKISQYPPDTTPTTDDLIITVDSTSGSNRKVAILDMIATFITGFSVTQIMTMLAGITVIGRNMLINGNMSVWQRGTTLTTPNDDTYISDRWNCLQEANAAWTFSRSTDVPVGAGAGSIYSMLATNVTANMQAGIVQILEGKDAQQLANTQASLSFWAKSGAGAIGNLRAAILSWTGTEDVVTSDVIATWAQNGTNPTWATNWTLENAPINLALTTSWQKFTIENVAIDTASMKNIAVVIWVDDGTITAADAFYVTQVQLNVGVKALPFQSVSYTQELQQCQRYYNKITTPHIIGVTPGSTTGFSRLGMQLGVEMRVAPASTVGSLPMYDGNTTTTISSVGTTYNTPTTFEIDGTASGSFAAGARPVVGYQTGAATLVLDAEL